MSLLQKKIILIVSGIVILLVTFFLVFQKNQETVYTLEAESRNFQNQVNHLSSLQIHCIVVHYQNSFSHNSCLLRVEISKYS